MQTRTEQFTWQKTMFPLCQKGDPMKKRTTINLEETLLARLRLGAKAGNEKRPALTLSQYIAWLLTRAMDMKIDGC